MLGKEYKQWCLPDLPLIQREFQLFPCQMVGTLLVEVMFFYLVSR